MGYTQSGDIPAKLDGAYKAWEKMAGQMPKERSQASPAMKLPK